MTDILKYLLYLILVIIIIIVLYYIYMFVVEDYNKIKLKNGDGDLELEHFTSATSNMPSGYIWAIDGGNPDFSNWELSNPNPPKWIQGPMYSCVLNSVLLASCGSNVAFKPYLSCVSLSLGFNNIILINGDFINYEAYTLRPNATGLLVINPASHIVKISNGYNWVWAISVNSIMCKNSSDVSGSFSKCPNPTGNPNYDFKNSSISVGKFNVWIFDNINLYNRADNDITSSWNFIAIPPLVSTSSSSSATSRYILPTKPNVVCNCNYTWFLNTDGMLYYTVADGSTGTLSEPIAGINPVNLIAVNRDICYAMSTQSSTTGNTLLNTLYACSTSGKSIRLTLSPSIQNASISEIAAGIGLVGVIASNPITKVKTMNFLNLNSTNNPCWTTGTGMTNPRNLEIQKDWTTGALIMTDSNKPDGSDVVVYNNSITSRYISIYLPNIPPSSDNMALVLSQVEVFDTKNNNIIMNNKNVSIRDTSNSLQGNINSLTDGMYSKYTTAFSNYAIEKNAGYMSLAYTSVDNVFPFIEIDLGAEYNISRLRIFNHQEKFAFWTSGAIISLRNGNNDLVYTTRYSDAWTHDTIINLWKPDPLMYPYKPSNIHPITTSNTLYGAAYQDFIMPSLNFSPVIGKTISFVMPVRNYLALSYVELTDGSGKVIPQTQILSVSCLNAANNSIPTWLNGDPRYTMNNLIDNTKTDNTTKTSCGQSGRNKIYDASSLSISRTGDPTPNSKFVITLMNEMSISKIKIYGMYSVVGTENNSGNSYLFYTVIKNAANEIVYFHPGKHGEENDCKYNKINGSPNPNTYTQSQTFLMTTFKNPLIANCVLVFMPPESADPNYFPTPTPINFDNIEFYDNDNIVYSTSKINVAGVNNGCSSGMIPFNSTPINITKVILYVSTTQRRPNKAVISFFDNTSATPKVSLYSITYAGEGMDDINQTANTRTQTFRIAPSRPVITYCADPSQQRGWYSKNSNSTNLADYKFFCGYGVNGSTEFQCHDPDNPSQPFMQSTTILPTQKYLQFCGSTSCSGDNTGICDYTTIRMPPQLPAIQPPVIQSPEIQPPAIQPPEIQPPAIQPPVIQSSAIPPPVIPQPVIPSLPEDIVLTEISGVVSIDSSNLNRTLNLLSAATTQNLISAQGTLETFTNPTKSSTSSMMKTLSSAYNAQQISAIPVSDNSFKIQVNDNCITVYGDIDYTMKKCENTNYSQNFNYNLIQNASDAKAATGVMPNQSQPINYPYSLVSSGISNNCLNIDDDGISLLPCNPNKLNQQWTLNNTPNYCMPYEK